MAHDNGQSRGPAILTVCILFLALSWITMVLRLYVRTKMLNSLGWDDATMLIGSIAFTVNCGILIREVTLGAGSSNVTVEVMGEAINVRFAIPTIFTVTDVACSTSSLAKPRIWWVATKTSQQHSTDSGKATILFIKIALGIFFLRIVVKYVHLID